jgi:phosphotriesterase-related protein
MEEGDLGMILPHEHVFVDLGPIEAASYLDASIEQVIPMMAPEIEKIKALGVTALVEASPVGVGRRADIVKAVSEAANFPVVLPTGIYREPWIPTWAHDASLEELRGWMVGELTGGIEKTQVCAGWIKLSAGDEGLTPREEIILRAAAQAGKETNAVIGSHTIKGSVVQEQLRIIEEEGYSIERFIWIHTHIEPDIDLHLEVARKGAWIEYDFIGGEGHPDDFYIERIQRVLDSGLGDRLLLSQDRGWYDPSIEGGGMPMPYTYLPEQFMEKMIDSGIDETTLRRLVRTNPFQAFAR